MSFNQPFGAPGPSPVEAPAADQGKSLNPVVLGAAAVGGAALLGAAAWFFVLSGPDVEQLAAGSPAPAVPASSVAATPSASPSPTPLPPTLGQAVRDPFKPLIVEATAAAAPAPGGVTMPGVTPSSAPVAPGGRKPSATIGPVLNPSTPSAPIPTAAPDQPDDDDVLAFGDTAIWDDDLAITITGPTPFKPSPEAIAADEPHYHRFEVTIVNNGTEVYEPAGFTVLAFTEDHTTMTEVIDRAQGVVGNPTPLVAPGEKVTFSLALGANRPDRLAIVVIPGLDYSEGAVFTDVPLSELDSFGASFAPALP